MTTFPLTSQTDTRNGGNGNDIFEGPAGGTDSLNGNGGADIFKIQEGQTGSIDGGIGTDTLRLVGLNHDRLDANLTITGIERLITESSYLYAKVDQVDGIAQFQTTADLSGQFDAFFFNLDGQGGKLDLRQSFTLSVNEVKIDAEVVDSAMQITGTANKDEIIGSDFADKVNGFNGNDRLYGGFGDDVLNGGLGTDYLYGDDGKDAYLFNTKLGASNVDHLGEFRGQDDTIQLEGSVFKWQGQSNGKLAANAFKVIGDGQQIDGTDRIIYNETNGKLYYDADGSGAAAMKLFAIADNFAGDIPQITHHDFVIV